jgi:hypothetical protein
MCERAVPSPIFIGACTFGTRFIWLSPEELYLPYLEFRELVKTKIQQHCEYHKEGIPAFGKIIHYVLRPDYDSPDWELMVYDVDGNRIKKLENGVKLKHGVPTGLYVR